MTDLHAQVLAQLGLTAAVRELLRQFESRCDNVVEAELEEVDKPESQALLYRAGFDPAVIDRFVADGHIGLGSLLARFDAIDGSMQNRRLRSVCVSPNVRCWRNSGQNLAMDARSARCRRQKGARPIFTTHGEAQLP